MGMDYCKWCGQDFMSVSALSQNWCRNRPEGGNVHHELYEGTEKSRYTCKYCGVQYSSLHSLTHTICKLNPKGRGFHCEPVL